MLLHYKLHDSIIWLVLRLNEVTSIHIFPFTDMKYHHKSQVLLLCWTCSSPDAMLHSASTKNGDLWAAPTLEVCNSQTSHQMWQVWLAENRKQVLCACSENRVQPDQKERGFWGRQCLLWTDNHSTIFSGKLLCLLDFNSYNLCV